MDHLKELNNSMATLNSDFFNDLMKIVDLWEESGTPEAVGLLYKKYSDDVVKLVSKVELPVPPIQKKITYEEQKSTAHLLVKLEEIKLSIRGESMTLENCVDPELHEYYVYNLEEKIKAIDTAIEIIMWKDA